jgi:hypothetical protein
LADPFACAVDAELHAWRAVQDGGGEEADGDGFADCEELVSSVCCIKKKVSTHIVAVSRSGSPATGSATH